MQKRRDDPDFKGAFHEKKSLNQKIKFKAERDKKNPNSKSPRTKSPKSYRKKH